MPGSIVDASTDDGQPSDWWRMNGTPLDTLTTAYDSGSVGTNNLTLEGGASWSTSNPQTGTSAGSLSLNGSTAYAQSTGPVITSTSSFAVSAWVYLNSLPTHNAAVAAQDGTTNGGFYLGYNYVNNGDWSFYFAKSDDTDPGFTPGVYGPKAVAGVWTQLTGVYNAELGEIQLYVNGVLAGSTAYTPTWSATGPFTVGRDLYNGAQTDFFPGLISDVRAYNDTLLWGYNVSEIYNDEGTSSITTANAGAALEDYAEVEPNLRDVIISIGANDVLEGESAGVIEANLEQLIADVQGQYDNDTGQGVQAFITTIPPLGLASSDPREGVREAVNDYLTGNNTTAAAVFDIASAVANPSSQNDVNPAYLTNGIPNSAYYQAIAQAIASGIENAFPPGSVSL